MRCEDAIVSVLSEEVDAVCASDFPQLDLSPAGRDAIAVRYRGVAVRVANKWVARHRWLQFDDLFAEAWAGVLLGARCYDPERGPLVNHLFRHAANAANAFALKYIRGGLVGVSRGAQSGFPSRARAIETVRPTRTEMPPETPCAVTPDHWSDDEWAALLRPLHPRQRELVEAVYRHGEAMCDLVGRFGPTDSAVRMAMIEARKRLAHSERMKRELE